MEFKTNVMRQQKLEDLIHTIITNTEPIIGSTMGPRGSTHMTVVGNGLDLTSTKDGWNLLQNIRFANFNANAIFDQLIRSSERIVTKVGDGTSSAFVAVSELYKRIRSDERPNIPQGQLLDLFKKATEEISSRIKSKEIDITTEEGFKKVSDIVKVSVNHNKELTDLVMNAINIVNDSDVLVAESPSNKTYIENISGYLLPNSNVLSSSYNNTSNAKTKSINPMVLVLDFALTDAHREIIFNKIGRELLENSNRQLYVFASDYSEVIEHDFESLRKQDMGDGLPPRIIPIRYNHTTNKANIRDLALLLGTSALDLIQWNSMFRVNMVEEDGKYVNTIEYEEGSISNYVGTCGIIEAGDEDVLLTDFIQSDDHALEQLSIALNKKLEETMERRFENGEVGTESLFKQRRRIKRIKGELVTIYVGGDNNHDKKMRHDAVEDAVKAASSAITHGYGIGGGFAVPIAAQELIDELTMKDYVDEDHELYEKGNDLAYRFCLLAIRDGFLNISKWIYKNAYLDFDGLKELELVREKGMCRDILTGEFSDSIINSVDTDRTILKHAVSMLTFIGTSSILISGTMDQDLI